MLAIALQFLRTRRHERALRHRVSAGLHAAASEYFATIPQDTHSGDVLQLAATAALEQDLNEQAETLARQALAKRPGDELAARIVLVAMRKLSRQREALDMGLEWARSHPYRARQIYKDIALLHGDLDELEQACAAAAKARRRSPRNMRVAGIHVFYTALVHGTKRARRQMLRWTLLHRGDSGFYWQCGQGFAEAGDLPLALRCYRKARKLDWTARVALGEVHALIANGQMQEAVDAGMAWLRGNTAPEAAPVWAEMASAHSKMGKRDDALHALKQAHECDPDNPRYVNERMTLLDTVDRADDAVALGREWLAAHPGRSAAHVHNRMGIVLHNAGRYPEAISAYTTASGLLPASDTFRLNHLQALADAGDTAAALALGAQLRQQMPGLPRYWELMMRLHRGCGDGAAALECARQRQRLLPKDPDAAADVIGACSMAGDRAAAHLFFGEWATAQGRHPHVLNEMGHLCLHQGDLPAAQAYYLEGCEADPDDSVLLGNLLNVLVQRGEAAQARTRGSAWLERGLQPRPHFLMKLAYACHEDGDSQEAVVHLDRILHLAPDFEDAAYAKLSILDSMGQPQAVEAFMTTWAAAHTLSGRLWNRWAVHLRDSGQLPRALTAFEHAVKAEPTPLHLSNHIRCLDQAGHTGEALRLGDQWMDAHGVDSMVCYHIARILLEHNSYQEALAVLERGIALRDAGELALLENTIACLRLLDRDADAIERARVWLAAGHPPTPFLLTEIAICHGQMGAHADAQDTFDQALAMEPGRESTFYFQLDHLLRTDVPAADAAAREWLDKGYPGTPRVRNLAALAAERCGDPARAQALYAQAAADAPENPVYHGNLLSVLLSQGHSREAYRTGKRVLQRHPDIPRLLNLTGVAAFETNRLEEATQLYQKAQVADPRNPYICGNLLQALHELKEFLEGVRTGENWRAREENHPNGYTLRWLALNYYGLNRKEQALAILRQIPADDSEYGQAMRTLASLLNNEGRHSESLDLLHSLPEGSMDSVGTHYEYSRAYRELGMHAAAVENARKAVELSPQSVDCAQLYLRTLRSAEDIDTAERFAEEWTAANGERAEILAYQGCLAHDRGDFERAASVTRKAMMTDPGFEPAARYLVKSLIALGRTREARITAESWLQENKGSPELRQLLEQINDMPEE